MMTEGKTPSPQSKARKRRSILQRKSFWALVVVAAYIGLGFLALPSLIKSTAIDVVADELERELSIGAVRTNPITLEIELEDVALRDEDGHRLAGLGRLHVDFHPLASLLNRAWTLRSVDIERAIIHEQRFADGDTRLNRMLATLARDAEPPPAEADDNADAAASPPRLVIQDLRLRDSGLRFDDDVPAEPMRLAVFPISLAVHDLDTRPGQTGHQSVELRIVAGGHLTWRGEFAVDPLRARGQVTLDGLVADHLLPYIRQTIPLTDFGLTLGARLDYDFALTETGPALVVDDIELDLSRLTASAFSPPREFLAADAIQLHGGRYDLATNAIAADELTIERPRGDVWARPNGEIALLDLLPVGDGNPADDHAAEADDATPTVDLAALRINNLGLRFADHSLDPVGEVVARNVDIALDNLSLAAGTSAPLHARGSVADGRFELDGDLTLLPEVALAAELDLRNLALASAEPWLKPHVHIDINDGGLDLAGHLRHGPDETFAWRGGLTVNDLDVHPESTDQTVLGWQRLNIERIDFALDERRLDTSPIELNEVLVRFDIAEDGSTNVGRLMAERGETTNVEAETDAPTDAEDDFRIDLAGLRINDTTLHFADHSLPLPFAARVDALNGRISRLASKQDEPADVDLAGEVGDYGTASIGGQINPWQPTRATDLELAFRNIVMPEYSPYSVRFAGRHIADGRLDLDLGYRIENQQLQGRNQITLRDLRLGERQPHPDAMNLPFGLAIALLKDSNGIIDIDLEVSGDVGDPEFAIGSVIRQALVNLITRVASSPFSLLASLVGSEDESLDAIGFAPGTSDIAPPDRERLDQLTAALLERPELSLEITGTYHPGVDGAALREQQALARIREHLVAAGEDDPGIALQDDAAWRAIQRLARENDDIRDVDALEALYLEPGPGPDGPSPFGPAAWRMALTHDFLAAQPVTEKTLEQLARARAEAVHQRLLATPSTSAASDDDPAADAETARSLAPERVRIVDITAVDERHESRIRIDMAVAARQ